MVHFQWAPEGRNKCSFGAGKLLRVFVFREVQHFAEGRSLIWVHTETERVYFASFE